jgi:hypothetical protein
MSLYYSAICLRDTVKESQDSQCSSRNSNQAPPEWKSEALPLESNQDTPSFDMVMRKCSYTTKFCRFYPVFIILKKKRLIRLSCSLRVCVSPPNFLVFYAVRVVWKGSRLLVLPWTSCLLSSSFIVFVSRESTQWVSSLENKCHLIGTFWLWWYSSCFCRTRNLIRPARLSYCVTEIIPIYNITIWMRFLHEAWKVNA